MTAGWKPQVAMAAVAAILICGVLIYREPGYVYEFVDRRPIPAVHTIEYSSDSLESAYRLFVQLPPGYSDSERRYPVLYALDGQAATQLYRNAVLPLIRRREIPEIIVVGVGYPRQASRPFGIQTSPSRRVSDYTTVEVPAVPQSGQADMFLAFLNDKVVPFIDATYRTDPDDRAIGGYELGGLVSFYAVLSQPRVFQRCLALEPRFSWGDDHIFEVESNVAASGRALDARVYLASFDQRALTAPAVAMMADTLRSRGYPALNVEYSVTSSNEPFAAIERVVAEGLTFLYDSPQRDIF